MKKFDSCSDWTAEDLDVMFGHIKRIARDKYDLDFYPNQIEVISSEQMLDCYAAVGMPIYYNHWSFGMQFVRESEGYKRGSMGLAYEIVINSNPCISYLMEENSMMMQALVMAHACVGHNSFFKGNECFKQWTDADMIIDYLVFARDYVRQCEEKYGEAAVEAVLDAAHALKYNGVDRYKRPSPLSKAKQKAKDDAKAKYDFESFDDIWRTLPPSTKALAAGEDEFKFPKEPEENLLYFIEKNSPNLAEWKREILRIVRKTSQYFYPQMMTQVMNEGWACVTGDTLIDTPNGLIRAQDLVETQYSGYVDDGTMSQRVVNWFSSPNRKRIRIEMNNGFVLHGGLDHKINVDGKWIELQNLIVGDVLPITRGRDQWPTEYVKLPAFRGNVRLTLTEACAEAGINIKTYYRWINNGCGVSRKAAECQQVAQYLESNVDSSTTNNFATRSQITCPTVLTENLAYWLGLITGDGGIYAGSHKRVYFVSGDIELRDKFIALTQELFGIQPKVKPDRNHWVVWINSNTMADYLQQTFSFVTGKSAHRKTVPPQLLTSPREVVAAFIRGHFDTDGCACPTSGQVILISKSHKLISVEQQLLLKFGIVSAVALQQADQCYRLTITGSDSKLFNECISFGLTRKRNILNDVLATKTCKTKGDTSVIKTITYDEGPVYDFSVANSHSYKASCFVNHNCFWHHTLMNDLYDEGLVTDGFMLEFAEYHTGVVPQRPFSRINPYALGWAMYKDIKRIVVEPTEEDRRWFPDIAGTQDWIKVVKHAAFNYKDESFILQYLSPKLIREFSLFSILDDDMNPTMIVQGIQNDAGYKMVREHLSNQHNINNLLPNIQVVDVDVWGDRSMELTHFATNRQQLNFDGAVDTLTYVCKLWGYNVRLTTVDSAGVEIDEYEVSPDELDSLLTD